MDTPQYLRSYTVNKEDFAAAGEVSGRIKRKLKEIGIDAFIIRKIAIACYEAEINMTIHSFGGKMNLEITPSTITVICADSGPGIPDIELAMQEGYSTASEDIRSMGFGAGMGLPNMSKNCDKMVVNSSSEGTEIQMTFFI